VDAVFALVWQKIAALEGAEFRSANGVPFTYTFHKTYVVSSAGRQSIPRTYFEKVFERLRQGAAEGAPALQGQSFILGILRDPRVLHP